MHPILAFAETLGPNIAPWLLAHSGELGDAFGRLAGPVVAAITDPAASVDRVGSALVAQQNGQAEVIGLLHRHTTTLDGIAAAVDGVGVSVDGVARSAGLLGSLSMVGLGVSVLAHAHLAFQFDRLTRRLQRLEAEVGQVREMMHADFRGALNAGLFKLKSGIDAGPNAPDRAGELFRNAIDNLTDSRARYTELLRGGVGAGNPQARWVLARHLTVAVLGEASGHIRLGEADAAVVSLEHGLGPVREHARAVFGRTVAARPGAFLMPALAEHGVTLEALAELYRQAGHAGVRDENRTTPADLFESLRPGLGSGRAGGPRFFKGRVVRRLRAEFAEASAAVEEVNRLKGLALAIGFCNRSGRDFGTLAEQIRCEIEARHPEDGACFAAFPPAEGVVQPAAGR